MNRGYPVINQQILDHFQQVVDELKEKIPIIEQEIHNNLKAESLKVHGVNSRLKSPSSLSGKLARPDKIYQSLSDITDLIGFRIVTYFEEDIDVVGKIIEQAFHIDYDNSIDKRLAQDPKVFGYRSLHYICRLEKNSPYSFEIQIRTILQHTWAEIEHDLGYKFPESVPSGIRRRFSRLAGLLELADQEFSSIKSQIKAYETKLSQGTQEDTPITDQLSLQAIVSEPAIRSIELELAEKWQLNRMEEIFYPSYLIKMLNYCDLKSRSNALNFLNRHRTSLILFTEQYSRFTEQAWRFSLFDIGAFKSGYSLFLLAHYKVFHEEALEIKKLEQLRSFYQHMDYPNDPESALKVAKIFLFHCC